jgi:hypothetical protein
MDVLIVLFGGTFLICSIIGCFWQSVKWVINYNRKQKGLKPIKSLF